MPLLSLPSTIPPLQSLQKLHQFQSPNNNYYPFLKTPSFTSKSTLLSLSTTSEPSTNKTVNSKPSPAENSRTIMELSSCGTLSITAPDGWPIGIGAQFVADNEGSPALCLQNHQIVFHLLGQSSFHVKLEQSRTRMAQCTVVGNLKKPHDHSLLNKLCARWEKKFGEEVDQEQVYVISVERVLQIEDFHEEGVWVPPLDYLKAEPDPLRNFAEKIVDEMNSEHVEDVQRLCKIYVDSEFQVKDTKIIWVDRRGFDIYMHSDVGIFSARIPFPREVTDEKGVKSAFNSMAHFAWEIEKNYATPDFEKVKCLKKN